MADENNRNIEINGGKMAAANGRNNQHQVWKATSKNGRRQLSNIKACNQVVSGMWRQAGDI